MHKGGRPTDYKPKFCQQIIDFFDIEPSYKKKIITTGKNDYYKEEEIEVANPIPHITDFAKKIGVNSSSIYAWAKKHEEFSNALKEVKLKREKIIESNALKGLYNASFAIFNAKNTLGWRDEQHIKHDGMNQIFNVIIPANTATEGKRNRLLDAQFTEPEKQNAD